MNFFENNKYSPVQLQNFDTPKKNSEENKSKDEISNKSEIKQEKHRLLFIKENIEEKALLDHKPKQDILGELRHTREYEESFEREHAIKILPLQKVESISHTLVDKIIHYKRPRSNSNLLIDVGSSIKIDIKKQRNSFLHYRDSLNLTNSEEKAKKINLKRL